MAKNRSIPTLAEVVGKNLHRLRSDYPMFDLITAARPYGVRWGAGSIGSFERGNARVTIETLTLLQLGLSNLLGRNVELHELLGFDPNYNPNEHWDEWDEETQTGINHNDEDYWGADKLVQWSEGSYLYVSDVVAWFDTRDPEVLKRGFERAQQLLNLMDRLPALVTPGEERLASKLGISAEQLQDWSQQLWGEAIEARRDRLAGEGASPQKRGRVSGKLLAEIRAAKEEGRLGNGQ